MFYELPTKIKCHAEDYSNSLGEILLKRFDYFNLAFFVVCSLSHDKYF